MKLIKCLMDIQKELHIISNCMQLQNPKPFDFDKDLVELIGEAKLKKVLARLDASYYEGNGVLPDDYRIRLSSRKDSAYYREIGISKEYINERFNGEHFIAEIQKSNQD